VAIYYKRYYCSMLGVTGDCITCKLELEFANGFEKKMTRALADASISISSSPGGGSYERIVLE